MQKKLLTESLMKERLELGILYSTGVIPDKTKFDFKIKRLNTKIKYSDSRYTTYALASHNKSTIF